ncbi:hypothetical protein TNCV_2416631 [Trichonephila clavipes]|nr:hypothetical protein TNCV_2416631 [Trichonephila clavipes]
MGCELVFYDCRTCTSPGSRLSLLAPYRRIPIATAKLDYVRPLRRVKSHDNWSSSAGVSLFRTANPVVVSRATGSRVMTTYTNLSRCRLRSTTVSEIGC